MTIDAIYRSEGQARSYYTLQQIASRHPAFSVRTLRHWIYNARDRPAWQKGRRIAIPGNGFARVMLKVGKRIYIDEIALFTWLEESKGLGDGAR